MAIRFHSLRTLEHLKHVLVDMITNLMINKDGIRLLSILKTFSEELMQHAHIDEVSDGYGKVK